ncbi:hypothetical protein SynBIOSU31_02660 [Synechococcus sp. BIOS-U3-1]|nr:hypothetical protein SynBIOSU31_02660 [Synechococcus sp. BIOS-U3-1]|tara:strand:+ start:406 stop:609 length:204 start_codon:yes stop_codon:yes gene_type:complete
MPRQLRGFYCLSTGVEAGQYALVPLPLFTQGQSHDYPWNKTLSITAEINPGHNDDEYVELGEGLPSW